MAHPREEDLDDTLQRAFRYALGLAHDRTDAEDLVQEACLRLGRSGRPWGAAYLMKTIRNLFVDEYRRRERVRFETLESAGIAREEADPTLHDELERALGRLRPEEREMLVLAAVEGYTTAEIAALVERPRGTVLSMIHRAKEKLRTSLGVEETRRLP